MGYIITAIPRNRIPLVVLHTSSIVEFYKYQHNHSDEVNISCTYCKIMKDRLHVSLGATK